MVQVIEEKHGGTGTGTIAVSFVRDKLGRVTNRTDSNGQNTTFTWDPNRGVGKLFTAVSQDKRGLDNRWCSEHAI